MDHVGIDYVRDALADVELTESTQRAEQPLVEIHAFSGLPWKYALTTYDAAKLFQ